MDTAIDNLTGLFLTLLPLGWYNVEFKTVAKQSEDVGNLLLYNPTYSLIIIVAYLEKIV
jgi:hypothetical protein